VHDVQSDSQQECLVLGSLEQQRFDVRDPAEHRCADPVHPVDHPHRRPVHDNRRQFIFHFGQGANMLDIFALNTQPIRENQIGDRNSHSRIFSQVAIVNCLKLNFVRIVLSTALHRKQRRCREVAIHGIGR
jgi:hypothetical protein